MNTFLAPGDSQKLCYTEDNAYSPISNYYLNYNYQLLILTANNGKQFAFCLFSQ
jgi:hypothetical protein